MDRARMQYPPARVGTGSGPGQARLQYLIVKAKTEDGLCWAGSGQPLALWLGVHLVRELGRCHSRAMVPTGEYKSQNGGSKLS